MTCFNCWSTNIPAVILHVKLKFEIGHSTCGTLLNKRRQALLTEQQQQSFNNCIPTSNFPSLLLCYAKEQMMLFFPLFEQAPDTLYPN